MRSAKPGQSRLPPHVSPRHQRPPALATGVGGAPTCIARHLATRRALQRDDSRSGGGALSLRTTLPHRSARCYDGVRSIRQCQRGNAQASPWPPCPGRQGSQRLCRRRVIPRLRRRATTRHFTRVCRVGFLRCTRPSDVSVVPATHHFARVYGVGFLWCTRPSDVLVVP
jgi:hypothetical protein